MGLSLRVCPAHAQPTSGDNTAGAGGQIMSVLETGTHRCREAVDGPGVTRLVTGGGSILPEQDCLSSGH